MPLIFLYDDTICIMLMNASTHPMIYCHIGLRASEKWTSKAGRHNTLHFLPARIDMSYFYSIDL